MGQPMTESSTLLNAQIGFLKTHLALIHIPPAAFPLLAQPILSLLLHNGRRDDDGAVIPPSNPWNFWHPFVNVSLTPNECSIVCPRQEAEALFAPLIGGLSSALRKSVTISEEDYSVITIGGEGLEAGQRVLDLTSPLALAGIPIFFITSYYSDFILVPLSLRPKVIHALEKRGFIFEAESEDGEAGHMTNPASPLLHQRHPSSSSSIGDKFGFGSMPVAKTPPPTTVSDLQTRTFETLSRNHITPHVDTSIDLVTCAGIKDSTPTASLSNFTQGKLHLGIAKCLTCCSPPPRFFSLTLTENDSASLTMERRLLHHFPDGGADLLLGTESPGQIPITLDLKHLPLESTGIVCGLSSRLTDGMRRRTGRETFDMSYLSTSRAGHVIVHRDELRDVMEALRGAQPNGVAH